MSDAIGFAGTFIILLTYALVQSGRLKSETLTYSVLNLAGALGMVISLVNNFNLPVLVLEGTWAIISIYGIYRALKSAPQRYRAGRNKPD